MHLVGGIYVCWAAGRCPRRERSAHVGASPPLSRSLGCGGWGVPPKGLCPPAEPPTPCVPRVYDCALFFSALHAPRASDVRRLQVAKRRACILGAGVHVGQAREFVFVEVAPCPCGQPTRASRWRMRFLWYAVASLFELPPVLLRRILAWRSCLRT
jgi:hypothetical protein